MLEAVTKVEGVGVTSRLSDEPAPGVWNGTLTLLETMTGVGDGVWTVVVTATVEVKIAVGVEAGVDSTMMDAGVV